MKSHAEPGWPMVERVLARENAHWAPVMPVPPPSDLALSRSEIVFAQQYVPAIWFHRSRGMSRERLSAIYGREAVRVALDNGAGVPLTPALSPRGGEGAA